MTKHMLIDATHPEESRVAVVSGKRLEEFDYELASRKQLKGNIYLAKVTRVEPSLQAAFVEYGGNRHGFLAFSEIHPDYYRIPVADRQALLAEEAAAEREEEGASIAPPEPSDLEPPDSDGMEQGEAAPSQSAAGTQATGATEERFGPPADTVEPASPAPALPEEDAQREQALPLAATDAASLASEPLGDDDERPPQVAGEVVEVAPPQQDEADVEVVGGDVGEVEEEAPRRIRSTRRYKIQEVVKRRQIMLVQVTKEERGNKGAALTTYLSLAGRYCVLMPNTARGGGVSRKITSPGDRKRLKTVIEDLDIPEGMAVIVRTAGSERSKAEIKRDYEYLLRMWDEIRELTLKSTAPALIYEEASLIKRSIRDLYTRDIDDIIVEGEEGYKAAKAFMRTLTPSHAKRVQAYKDPVTPLFHRYQVESQIDAIHNPVVQLKSGGYLVINSTEALVAIDVNSGRSTRERNIEETALRTNLEAADEVARQLRLRDLAGLIVIDFIDMEEQRHNAAVERRLKEAMRHDRARIQLGRISHFGLLELSRQRLRPSLFEASMEACRHCGGTGHIRSVNSSALHVLRSIEDEGMRSPGSALVVAVATGVALYILNQKRRALGEIEQRHDLQVHIVADDSLVPPDFRIERVKPEAVGEQQRRPVSQPSAPEEEEEAAAAPEETPAAAAPEEEGAPEAKPGRRRSRRRRRKRDEDRTAPPPGREAPEAGAEEPAEERAAEPGAASGNGAAAEGAGEPARRRRRRGKRGGRRRSRGEPGELIEDTGAPHAAERRDGGGEGSAVAVAEPGEAAAPGRGPAAESAEPAFETLGREAFDLGVGVAQAEARDRPDDDRGRAEEAYPEAGPSAPSARPSGGEEEREPVPHAVADRPAQPRRGWWKRLVE